MKQINTFISQYWILLLFVALKFVLQFTIVNPEYELQRDEFLHLDQANHPSFGYISVPPFTAWVSTIIYFLGGSIFWVRFFPALFGALTLIVGWITVEALGGKLLSKVFVASALVFSVLMRMNILYQPNSLDILVWTTIFFLVVKYINNQHHRWLYLLSIVVAIGFYNKYNVAFLLVGLFISLGFTQQRKLLFQSALWRALLFAVVLILPNLIWQFVNDFPVIKHMNVLKETQLNNNSAAGFLINQLLFFSGALPLIIGALAAFVFYKPFKPYRVIGLTYVVVMTLFVILKAKDYYAIGLYPVLFAFGSVFLVDVLSRKWRMIVIPGLIIINLGLFVVTAKIIFPIMSPAEIAQNKDLFEPLGMLRWEDGKNHQLPQDFADMIGWHEMADKSLDAYKLIPVGERHNTLLFCDNYGQTGALNYYNRGKISQAYSFSNDYIYWLPRYATIQNMILVGKRPADEIIAMFKEFQTIGIVENQYSREKGTGIYFLSGASPSFTKVFYQMADEREQNFDIFR